MAKKVKKAKKAAEKRERILGIATTGTTKGNILAELMDQKLHTIESLAECRVEPTDSVGWRLTTLKAAGKRAKRPFKLEIGEDKVRLTFTGKAPKEEASAKSKKSAPAKKEKSAGKARASVQDVPTADDDD